MVEDKSMITTKLYRCLKEYKGVGFYGIEVFLRAAN